MNWLPKGAPEKIMALEPGAHEERFAILEKHGIYAAGRVPKGAAVYDSLELPGERERFTDEQGRSALIAIDPREERIFMLSGLLQQKEGATKNYFELVKYVPYQIVYCGKLPGNNDPQTVESMMQHMTNAPEQIYSCSYRSAPLCALWHRVTQWRELIHAMNWEQNGLRGESFNFGGTNSYSFRSSNFLYNGLYNGEQSNGEQSFFIDDQMKYYRGRASNKDDSYTVTTNSDGQTITDPNGNRLYSTPQGEE